MVVCYNSSKVPRGMGSRTRACAPRRAAAPSMRRPSSSSPSQCPSARRRHSGGARRCSRFDSSLALDLYMSIRRARLRRLTPRGRGRPFPRPLQISRGPSRRDSPDAGLVRSTALSTTSLPGCQLSRRPSCLFLLNPPTPGPESESTRLLCTGEPNFASPWPSQH